MQNSVETKVYIVLYSKLYNKVVLNNIYRNKSETYREKSK